MDIREIAVILNQMVADEIIRSYAIGGAAAATMYAEPISTVDVDVFAPLEATAAQPIISMAPIFGYLKAKGYVQKGEYIVVGDWPIQFISLGTPLAEEAMKEAVTHSIAGEPLRVFSAEHLIALAVDLGRPDDRLRVRHLFKAGKFDRGKLSSIIERFNLSDKWAKFRQYLD